MTATVFVAAAAVTIAWCGSMSAMPGMPMPGGWTMSMAWMRMPGQSWPGAAATFIGMWGVMMLAMMLPVVAPRLATLRGARALLASAGYFGVWLVAGALIYPLGVALAELSMRSDDAAKLVPYAGALTVILAGSLQFTRWKQRTLACCRASDTCCDSMPRDNSEALRFGATLGIQCLQCCLGLTLVLLVLGVMDLRAMALVTAAISLERLAPFGERWARAIGVALIASGIGMIAA